MIPRSVAAHPLTAEAVECFNRLMSLYCANQTAMGEAWASAERIMRSLVKRVEDLEAEIASKPSGARDDAIKHV